MAAKKGAEQKAKTTTKKTVKRRIKNITKSDVKTGAPRSYTDEELIAGVEKYISDWETSNKVYPPFVTDCAKEMGISKDTLYRRAKESQALSDSIKRINTISEAHTLKGALVGKYASAPAIFWLKNLGLTDQPQQEQADTTVKVVIEQADYGD